jgi:hypothetical protein
VQQNARTEVFFVLPFHFCHRQQAINKLIVSRIARVTRGSFIFANVATLKPAGAIHRREPAGEVAQATEHAPDD